MEDKSFVHWVRIPKTPNPWPFPFPTDFSGLHAKCPKCGRITTLRVCYGCKEVMCEECLIEHQISCLHK